MPLRRDVLVTAAALGTIAGCDGPAGDGTDGQDPTDDRRTGATRDDDSGDSDAERTDGADEVTDEDADDRETRTTGDGSGTTGTPALDLREANVVGVDVEDAGEGEYRFDVTLFHDDEGEDGYANWWQVETPAGERLGRRDLAHAHGTREFTRSTTVSVPADVDCVVVRGHDQTHEYGGQAMVVALPGGETRAVAQGAEPQSLAEAGCP